MTTDTFSRTIAEERRTAEEYLIRAESARRSCNHLDAQAFERLAGMHNTQADRLTRLRAMVEENADA